jgi:hypothetical protein
VVENLSPKLDKLNDMLTKLGVNASPQGGGGGGAHSELAPTIATASLMESANKVVSNASDIMGSRPTSCGGSEPVPTLDSASDSSRVRTRPHLGTRPDSTMSHDSLGTDHRTRINDWNQRVTRSEPGSPSSRPSPRRTTRPRPRPRGRTAPVPSEIPTIPEDMEVDGDIKLELIQSMIQIALGNLSSAQKEHKAYSMQRTKCNNLEPAYRKASNTLGNVLYKKLTSRETIEDHQCTVQVYKEHFAARERHHKASQELGTRAEKGFKLALAETAKLTPANSASVDLHEVRLNLAFAYEVREKLDRAESLFRVLADNGVQGAVDTALMLRACQALAALYLRQKRLDEAHGFCKRAWLGRRRIFGREHATYRESMVLNIEICKAKGQVEVAEAYMAALPPDPKKPKVSEVVDEERQSSRSRGRYWSPPPYRFRAGSTSGGSEKARSKYAYV